jgi:excisionase family DNA binding protein
MKQDTERKIEQYVSTAVLMEALSISRSTVYRLIARGIPNIMIGSVHRFPIDKVLKWLEMNYGDRTGQ